MPIFFDSRLFKADLRWSKTCPVHVANYLSCRRLRIRLSVMKFQWNFLLWRGFTLHPRTKQHVQVFVTIRRRSCGKVMFLVICVCQSVCLGRGDSHVTVTHDTLDLTAQGPLSRLWTWDLTVHAPQAPPPLLLVTSDGQDFRPVPTCSLQDPCPPVLTSDSYWKHKQLAGRWYASHCNAFLFVSKNGIYSIFFIITQNWQC